MPKTNTIKLFTPHSLQRRILDAIDKHTYTLVNCGRQVGKTTLGWNWLLKETLSKTNKTGVWVSRWHKQSSKVFDTVVKATEGLPLIQHINKQDRIIQFTNGSQIKFFSADNYESIRGESINFLVCDEFALFKREAWDEAIRPTIAAQRNPKVLLLSTPRGRGFWFDLFQQAKASEYPEWCAITAPSTESPYINKSWVQDAKKTYPIKKYKQEILAEFIDDQGALFSNVAKCCRLQPREAQATPPLVAAVDCGFVHDYTVVTVFNQNKEMVDILRFNDPNRNYKRAARKIDEFLAYYKYPKTRVEINKYDSVYTELKQLMPPNTVFEFNTTAKSKANIINYIATLFANEDIKLIDNPTITEEFFNYTYQYTNSGNVVFNASSGYHDDIVMSSAIALSWFKENKATNQFDLAFIHR